MDKIKFIKDENLNILQKEKINYLKVITTE